MLEVIVDVVKYSVYGATAALLGYLKDEKLPNGWKALATKEFWEKFDIQKASKTVLVAFFLGAVTRGTFYLPTEVTQNPDFVSLSLVLPSLIVLGVENLLKILFRRTPLMKLWNKTKDVVISILERIKFR